LLSKRLQAIAFCLLPASVFLHVEVGRAAGYDAQRDINADQEIAGKLFWNPPTILAADTSSTTRGASAQNPGKKVGTGASGAVRYGFNVHAWPMGMIDPMLQKTGAKVLRIPVSYSQYVKAGTYPGKNNGNAVTQATVDAASAAGMDVLISITNPSYPASATAMGQWPAFVEAVAAANSKNPKVIFELGNEPDYTKVSAQQYFDLMKLSYPALKKGSADAKMAGPVINVSYSAAAKKFIAQLMAIPGVFELFDFGDFHPYYYSPETSYFVDLDAFIRSVDTPATKAGKSMEFIVSEVGWSNATGALAAIGNRPRTTGDSIVQSTDAVADFYSRYIPITRATHKLRLVAFYGLVDEGAADPDMKDVHGHFGIFVNANTPKPSALVVQDLLSHVHAASSAEMFTRSGTAGREDSTADWFVRLDTPQNHELIAWTAVAGGRAAQITVNAQQAGTLSIKVAGAATPTEVALSQGEQVVDVPLGSRSVILSSSVPIDFPEFK
jgi:hypothetical protein